MFAVAHAACLIDVTATWLLSVLPIFTSGSSGISGRYFDSTSVSVHSLCDVILSPDDTGGNLITSQLLSGQQGKSGHTDGSCTSCKNAIMCWHATI